MKTSLAIYSPQALSECLSSGAHDFDQLLIHVKGLSRLGTISLEQLSAYQDFPCDICLVWDVLMTEEEFQEKKQIFDKANDLFVSRLAWRVVDMGAIHYLSKHDPIVNFEVDATTGFHNSWALKTLQTFTGPALKKIVLSLELPEAELREIHHDLHTDTEILALGPIPLFYTPRHLLQRFHAHRALGKSEETPHSGFVIEDNSQGTFMWLPKDLFLLDHLDEIANSGVKWVRFDCPLAWAREGAQVVRRFNAGPEDWRAEALLLKKKYAHPTIKGFFKANRTDSLFTKLKNQTLRNKNIGQVGEIIDLEKGRFMVARLKSGVKLGDSLAMQTPEGRVNPLQLRFLRNSLGEELSEAKAGDLVVIPHVSGACVGSVLDRV
ncbi:MAG: hypothetical protein A2X86_15195 [Bdellovibrionales bacterium GWA2_49_15]|nr:MAG: hypothetical protein A2X86_15195 [Bdellovibrionales bacterium GWA2_49_15]HAZ13309.1 hypothetical protein [Bdellovibrionales bacterium]